MDDREKLIELMKKTPITTINGHTVEAEVCFIPHVFANMADHLIANGVTFATDNNDDYKWIPVTERLPKNEHPWEEYIVSVTRNHWPTSSYDPCDAPYDEEYTTTAQFDDKQKIWHLRGAEVELNALIMPEDSCINSECVTHWMPLPEPPEVE